MTTSSNRELALRPCPFCGGEAEAGEATGTKFKPWVQCTACGADVVGLKVEDARTIWNTRAALTPSADGAGEREDVHDAATGKPVPGPWTRELVEGMGLHHRTAALVNGFAYHLAEKLRKAEIKYGWTDGWASDEWEKNCRDELHKHVAKGDPLDVGAYAAFCWYHHWPTALPVAPIPSGGGEEKRPRCEICGAYAWTILDTDGPKELRRCNGCGLEEMAAVPSPSPLAGAGQEDQGSDESNLQNLQSAPAPLGGWRPMSELPMDGTVVLLSGPHGFVGIGAFQASTYGVDDLPQPSGSVAWSGHRQGDRYPSTFMGGWRVNQATGWMPTPLALPLAPDREG